MGLAFAGQVDQDPLPHALGLLHHFPTPVAALVHDGRRGGLGPLHHLRDLGLGSFEALLRGVACRLQHLDRLVAESLGHPILLQLPRRSGLELRQALRLLGDHVVKPADLRGGLPQPLPHRLRFVTPAHGREVDLLDLLRPESFSSVHSPSKLSSG